MKIKYLLCFLAPVALFAGGSGGETDIIPRTINFLLFFAILYYYVAAPIKGWFSGRKNGIAAKLDSIQSKLRESNAKKELAVQKVAEAKVNAKVLVETAKKEAELLCEKVLQEAEAEIKSLERSFEERSLIERRHMQRAIVCEILDEVFKEGSISLDNEEIVKIINKKVA